MAKQRSTARRPVRRQHTRSKEPRTGALGKFFIMLAIVAAFVLGVAIFFQVRQVEVQGNRIYSEQQVAEVSGIEAGDNLLTVNKAQIVGNINANLPYIQKVSVGRILPDTVVIRVQESEVAGLIQSDLGTGWYINSDGRIMGPAAESFQGQTIEITGVTVAAPQSGQQAVAALEKEGELEAALSILKAMDGTGLMELVTAIQAEESFDLHLICGEQYDVKLGGTMDLEYKIWYLQEVLKQLDPYQEGVIDLTMSEKKVAHFFPWE